MLEEIRRLLHCKGTRVVRCVEVPMHSCSLNTGDVFILDLGSRLYVWNGEESNDMEKVTFIYSATHRVPSLLHSFIR